MSLNFSFVGNACGIFQGPNGTKLLLDPWVVDGVFEGSWCHFPPIQTRPQDLGDVDAIYVSHIHPDHFDDRFFEFPTQIPIFILRSPGAFLERKLKRLGFSNVIPLDDGETGELNELELTILGPFAKHNFHEAKIGNLIDSALIVSDGEVTALNANDNTPTPESCRSLKERFGPFDLAMLNYNAAGPYPACFDNLSLDEKFAEHERLLERNIDYLIRLLEELEPRAFLPFAGAYALGGHLRRLNKCLGTTTWENCASAVKKSGFVGQIVTLRENDVLDLKTMTASRPYLPFDENEALQQMEPYLASIRYPYESDPEPDPGELISDLEIACRKMHQRAEALSLETTFTVYLQADGLRTKILPDFSLSQSQETRRLECTMDARLLRRILDRKAQWNSAEIGCHISFFRSPNLYEPDLHSILQFLHL